MVTLSESGKFIDRIALADPEHTEHVARLHGLIDEAARLTRTLPGETAEHGRVVFNSLASIAREITVALRGRWGVWPVCSACGAGSREDPIHPFVVHDDLWAAVCDKRDTLCLPCFETRLGRVVTPADLKDDYRSWAEFNASIITGVR